MHVWWCLEHVWWRLVVSGGVWWCYACLMVSHAWLVVSGAYMVHVWWCPVGFGSVCWCLIVSSACMVMSVHVCSYLVVYGVVWCMSRSVRLCMMHVWLCLDHVWWCLVHVWWCLLHVWYMDGWTGLGA